jgi:beta-galactosidase/beta-glucuronidase
VPKIFYLGDNVQDFSRSPMVHGPKYDFHVDVDVHVRGTDRQGCILLCANFTNATTSANVDSQIVTLSILAPKERIQLWWPSSTRQPLYTLQVSYQSEDGFQTEWITKTIGFRTLDLITINDTDPAIVQESLNQEGSGNHGMFFRVNGAVTWVRGANVVPMDQLEGRLTEDAHRIMVYSAAEAGMNMIRVWGGGMVMPQRFYDACDEIGFSSTTT